jgi:hypothetical protein
VAKFMAGFLIRDLPFEDEEFRIIGNVSTIWGLRVRSPHPPLLSMMCASWQILIAIATTVYIYFVLPIKIRGFDLMSAHDANAPAHPTDPTMLDKGLSKREYIAAIALAATDSSATAQERAKQAVELADALFKALYS